MQYTFHWKPALDALPQMLWGTMVTLEIALFSVLLGILVSIILALFDISNDRFLKSIKGVWAHTARNTPALFQIYMIYFGLGSLGLRIDSYLALIAGITFNCSGYLAETFRSAIQAIPENQHRAARSLGMSASSVFIWIVLPQVFRLVFYPVTNQTVWAIHMTALGVVVGLTSDLMGVTQNLSVISFRTFEHFLIAAIIYYLIVKFIVAVSRLLASRLFNY
jgi:hydroxyproline transport system permease protein